MQAFEDRRADAEFDSFDAGFDRESGIGVVGDGHHALRFAGGDLLVGGVNAGVELVGLALETVFVAGLGGIGLAAVAAAGAGERGFEGSDQEQGEVGLEVVAHRAVQGQDAVGAEFAAGALVGLG